MTAKCGHIVVCVLVLIITISSVQCYVRGYSARNLPGYSFAKFMGPVSGAEQKVAYYDDGMYKGHDYVAKPDYHFEYGVEDPNSKVHQSRQETRHGDTVQGEYSVLDPDGKFRTVKYTADKKNGFHASIITDGHVVHHPQDPVKPIHQDPVHHVHHAPPQEPPQHTGGGGGGGEEYDYEGDEESDDEGGDESGDEEEYIDSGGEGEEDGDGEEDEYY